MRITRGTALKNLESAVVALPHCFTNITSVSMVTHAGATSDDKSLSWVGVASGFTPAAPAVVDNTIVLRKVGDALTTSGHYATVQFTATSPTFVAGTPPSGCALGSHTFLTAATEGDLWNGNDDASRIFSISGNHPTITIANDTASIAGTVFNDLNGNGTFDALEPPLAGAVISLFADTNTNGVYDVGTDLSAARRPRVAHGSHPGDRPRARSTPRSSPPAPGTSGSAAIRTRSTSM